MKIFTFFELCSRLLNPVKTTYDEEEAVDCETDMKSLQYGKIDYKCARGVTDPNDEDGLKGKFKKTSKNESRKYSPLPKWRKLHRVSSIRHQFFETPPTHDPPT